MAGFVYDKKESKGSGRRQFILSRYGVRFHFGHATQDFTDRMIGGFQKKCVQWLDSLSQKEVDFYRDNYYKSTVYIGRAKVEDDTTKGKSRKPVLRKPAKKTVKKATKKSAKKTAKKAAKKAGKKAAKKR